MSCVCYKTECPQSRKRGLRVWFVFPSISIRAPQDYRRPVGVPKTLLEELVQRARLSHRRRADNSPEEGRHQMSIEDGDHHMLNKLLLSLVARSVTPPSPPTSPRVRRYGEGGRHLPLQQRASGGGRGPPEAPCAAQQCGNRGAPALTVTHSVPTSRMITVD